MPLVDFIASFYKKHDTLYDAFVGACLELKECKDIKNNLAQIYKCLRHEQTRQTSFRCLEYFMDSEMASFVYKLGHIGEKKVVMDFLADFISILPAKCFSRLNSFFNSVFESKDIDELGLALTYSERTIVLGCGIRTALVDYSLRFFFEEGLPGECSRACIVYLICSKRALDHLESMSFVQAVIGQTNRMYFDLEKKMPLYLSLLQFISYYARKETDLCKTDGDTFDGRKSHFLDLKSSRPHPTRSPLLLARGKDSKLHSILDLLEFPHVHSARVYMEILESTGSSNIRALVIDSVLTTIENTDDPARFVRFCVESHPELVAPYLIKSGGEDWSPINVLQKVVKMKGKGSSVKVPYVCHVDRHRISIIDFLIENGICDDLVFLFIWAVSKETFCTHFEKIQEMFKDHETFWGDLWSLILAPLI